jgi:hypothetical protein
LEVTKFAGKEEGEEERMQKILLRQNKEREQRKKPLTQMKFIQINLTHNKAAMAVLCWQPAVGMADVALT